MQSKCKKPPKRSEKQLLIEGDEISDEDLETIYDGDEEKDDSTFRR